MRLRPLATAPPTRGRERRLAVTILIVALVGGPGWVAAAENRGPTADAGVSRQERVIAGVTPVVLDGRFSKDGNLPERELSVCAETSMAMRAVSQKLAGPAERDGRRPSSKPANG